MLTPALSATFITLATHAQYRSTLNINERQRNHNRSCIPDSNPVALRQCQRKTIILQPQQIQTKNQIPHQHYTQNTRTRTIPEQEKDASEQNKILTALNQHCKRPSGVQRKRQGEQNMSQALKV
jgi:hypothetical protein